MRDGTHLNREAAGRIVDKVIQKIEEVLAPRTLEIRVPYHSSETKIYIPKI